MDASMQVSGIESGTIDSALETIYYKEETVKPWYVTVPRAAGDIPIILGAFSPFLDDMALYERLSARLELVNFHASLVSIYAPDKEYHTEEDNITTNLITDVTDDE